MIPPLVFAALASGMDSDTYCSSWVPGYLLIPAQTLNDEGLIPCRAYSCHLGGLLYGGMTAVPHCTMNRVRPERFIELQTR